MAGSVTVHYKPRERFASGAAIVGPIPVWSLLAPWLRRSSQPFVADRSSLVAVGSSLVAVGGPHYSQSGASLVAVGWSQSEEASLVAVGWSQSGASLVAVGSLVSRSRKPHWLCVVRVSLLIGRVFAPRLSRLAPRRSRFL
ncbi:hypothetical protein BDZ89DRAFT_1042242 [Hymenopellis radicata]|nr:hypothetical protein BDZ89DRAFT_1042242 [Hymenopellis radicata]